MIDTEHITKRFGRKVALNDLTISIDRNTIVCLLGANGAGKSTLFDILTTLDNDFEGDAFIDGLNVKKDKQKICSRIGYVPAKFSLYNILTVKENIDFFAAAYGYRFDTAHPVVPQLWESLAPFSKFRAENLSGGMKQKLSLCCAAVHHPDVYFLDELTTGIDPVSRQELWQEMEELKKEGATMIMSTHYIDEAENADSIFLLDEGQKVLFDSPKTIMETFPKKSVEIVVANHRQTRAANLEDVFVDYLTRQHESRS